MILRLDQPTAALAVLRSVQNGDSVSFDIPVVVSAQDANDVASSICDATFICEELASGISEDSTISFEVPADDPNSDIVRVSGTLADTDAIIAFIEEWLDTLDPNGSGEPFALTSQDHEDLFDRMVSDEPSTEFTWPELVDWFREAYPG